MRSRDDWCLIVNGVRKNNTITHCSCSSSRPAQVIFQQFFCSEFFLLSDNLLLIELKVKGESKKLLLSDTFVVAQTFSIDDLLVTRLAVHW